MTALRAPRSSSASRRVGRPTAVSLRYVISAKSATAALAFLTDARQLARLPPRVRLFGPVPAAMAKRAGRYHAQLLIESADRSALHRFS